MYRSKLGKSYLPPRYSISEGRLAYNKEWDETAELQSDSEEECYDLSLTALYKYVLYLADLSRKLAFTTPKYVAHIGFHTGS